MKRNYQLVLAVSAALVVGLGVAYAAGVLNLPPYPVTVTHGPWLGGQYSTLDVFLSDVGPGYDVSDGRYNGWCIEDNLQEDPPDDSNLPLMDTTDPASFVFPCENYDSIPWDHVNYLLNHKAGTTDDIQVAMWVLALTDFQGQTQSAATQAMVADALANGNGFVPGSGQIVAVAICADGISNTPGTYQDTIFEVLIPEYDGQGCTPGYWKQFHHLGSWSPDYHPGDYFADVFDVTDPFTDPTLLEALWMKGGKEKALLRHATAALLNAASADVNYYYTVDQVISMVQDAYANGTFNIVKDQLEMANEMGCPLGTAFPVDYLPGER